MNAAQLVSINNNNLASSTTTNNPATTSNSAPNTPNINLLSDNDNKIDSNQTNSNLLIGTSGTPEEVINKLISASSSASEQQLQDPVKILAVQQTKLGLLFQTRALEDKV